MSQEYVHAIARHRIRIFFVWIIAVAIGHLWSFRTTRILPTDHDDLGSTVPVWSLQKAPSELSATSNLPPPSSVEFDLRQEKNSTNKETQKALEYYIRSCIGDVKRSHARNSPLMHKRTEFLTNPACRELALQPAAISAARTVLGLSSEAPLWLFAVNRIRKSSDHKHVHRLHSDMEFSYTKCRPLGGATLWILLAWDCPPNTPSPLTLLSGSHLLNQTAHEELIQRHCWSKTLEELPCNVTALLEELESKHTFVKTISGPTQVFTGIAWPTTAWHMTNDTCRREAVTLEYVASLECARNLFHAFPTRNFGQFQHFPDHMPLVPVADSAKRLLVNDSDALQDLLSLPSPGTNSNRCLIKQNAGNLKAPRVAQGSWHISGPFTPKYSQMDHVGYSLQPRVREVNSDSFLYWVGRTHYSSRLRHNRAHEPHNERSLEVCSIIQGRINYALSPQCDEYFDVLSMSQGQVAVLFPGIYHTAAPNDIEDGEHICIKIFPRQPVEHQKWQQVALAASLVATESVGIDYNYELENKRAHDIIYVQDGKEKNHRRQLNLPGFSRLHIKVVKYQKGEKREPKSDPYDLVVVVLQGHLQAIAGDQSLTPLPEHEVAVIPAGTAHAFSAPEGPTRVLFIEVAPDRRGAD